MFIWLKYRYYVSGKSIQNLLAMHAPNKTTKNKYRWKLNLLDLCLNIVHITRNTVNYTTHFLLQIVHDEFVCVIESIEFIFE